MLDEHLAQHIIDKLREKDVEIVEGLTSLETDNIEELLGAKLPPDLKMLLQKGLPVSQKGDTKVFPQWRQDPEGVITDARKFIGEAFVTDIENNNYWSPLFGEKTKNIDDAKQQALKVIHSWPPLVRVYGHRYMPTEPHESGNPVLSVWQAVDTVYYGNDLIDYLVGEFHIDVPVRSTSISRRIPYWSDAFGLQGQ